MTENHTFEQVKKSLQDAGIYFVRILWCDNANIIRGKAVHLGMLSHYFEHGVGISAGQEGIPVMYDAVVPETGLGSVGEIRLVPDWCSLTPLPSTFRSLNCDIYR
ncbi:MAG: hypothetical protein KME49_07485 [Brasilonema octagenarum HA4186-MV1]|jgi:glutamine synthetase|nr:hypothetical protein [Brasilonema octagenarum HA4186-MV1]